MANCCEDKRCEIDSSREQHRSVLWVVLGIKAVMFIVEGSAGLLARATRCSPMRSTCSATRWSMDSACSCWRVPYVGKRVPRSARAHACLRSASLCSPRPQGAEPGDARRDRDGRDRHDRALSPISAVSCSCFGTATATST